MDQNFIVENFQWKTNDITLQKFYLRLQQGQISMEIKCNEFVMLPMLTARLVWPISPAGCDQA